MPPQLREIGFHVENHATQWHGFQHEIQLQEVVVAWIQLTLFYNVLSTFFIKKNRVLQRPQLNNTKATATIITTPRKLNLST